MSDKYLFCYYFERHRPIINSLTVSKFRPHPFSFSNSPFHGCNEHWSVPNVWSCLGKRRVSHGRWIDPVDGHYHCADKISSINAIARPDRIVHFFVVFFVCLFFSGGGRERSVSTVGYSFDLGKTTWAFNQLKNSEMVAESNWVQHSLLKWHRVMLIRARARARIKNFETRSPGLRVNAMYGCSA